MKESDRSGAASSASEEKSDKDEKVKTRTAQVPRPSVSGGTKLIAVVTGASSGLGSEFVHQIDRSSAERFDEIWVIARRLDRLEELRDSISTPVKILSFDLTKKSNLEAYSKELAKSGVVIGLLINAAGFGKIGSVKDIPLESIDSMIDLNCRAAVDMTQLSLPYMRAGSRIMEICSTAGFSPFPYLNVYAASKAFRKQGNQKLPLLLDGPQRRGACALRQRTRFCGFHAGHHVYGAPLLQQDSAGHGHHGNLGTVKESLTNAACNRYREYTHQARCDQ